MLQAFAALRAPAFRLLCAAAAAALAGAPAGAAKPDDKRMDPATLLLEQVVRAVEALYIEPVAPDDFAPRVVDALNGAGPAEAAMVACEKEAGAAVPAGAARWLGLIDAAVRCARGPAGGGADVEGRVDLAVARALARLDPAAVFLRKARATSDKAYWLSVPAIAKAGVVGLLLRPADAEGATIYATVPGAGGDAAGIRVGDKLLAVDGRPVARMPLDAVYAGFAGEAGSSVELRVRRAGGEVVELRAVRTPAGKVREALHASAATADALAPTAVKTEYRGGILIFTVPTLVVEQTENAIRKGVKDAAKAGGPAAIVLDLRHTPSGAVDAAEDVADLFLDRGVISRVVARAETHTREAKRGTIVPDSVPLFVIQSESTGGSGAIIAAALADAGRATTIGQPARAAGKITAFYSLRGDRAIYVPAGKIYRANGRLLSDGLEPAILAEVGPLDSPIPQAILDRVAAAAAAAAPKPR
jgi:carboxyl-terminal processing protease